MSDLTTADYAELDQLDDTAVLRQQVEQARSIAVALEQENAELTKQVESVRAFAVSHEYRWLMELLDGVGTHGGHL